MRRSWAALALVLACEQGQRLPGSPPVDPRHPALVSRFEPMELAIHPLVEHADYDRWEAAVEARGGPRLVHALYQQMLTKQRGTSRTFMRWVHYAHEKGLGDEVTDQLRQLVDALASRNDADSDPDILFILGYLGWVRLIGDAGEPPAPFVNARGADALVGVVRKSWEPMVKRFPEWVGPHGLTTKDVARWNASLVPAESQPPQATTAPEPPAALGGVLHRVGEKGAKVACEGLDEIVAGLPQRTPAVLASLGDVYALCALERGNAPGALEQLGRMLEFRVAGGYGAVLARVGDAAPEAVRKFKEKAAAVRVADPAFARSTGLP